VFGAHRSYTVTNGTSSSNRIIFMASLTRGDVALCDRNCHKSIEHGLIMVGRKRPCISCRTAIATDHRPDLSRGPATEQIRARFETHPLAAGVERAKPRHTVITTRPTTASSTTSRA